MVSFMTSATYGDIRIILRFLVFLLHDMSRFQDITEEDYPLRANVIYRASFLELWEMGRSRYNRDLPRQIFLHPIVKALLRLFQFQDIEVFKLKRQHLL